MLWKYAPANVMVGGRPTGSVCGASSRGLQMGRHRWRSPLLRSGLPRRRKDLYLLFHVRGNIRAACAGRIAASGGKYAPPDGRTRLQRVFHNVTGERSDILRRRCDCRALEPRAAAQAQSEHHLALERPAAGQSSGRRFLSSAAFGSWYLHTRRDHHRSRNGRLTKQQQCDFFRTAAVRARAAAQVARSPFAAGA
jgi:hypothetical protein